MNLYDIDASLFLFLNRGIQNGLCDAAMPLLTSRAPFLFLPLVVWMLIRTKGKALYALLVGIIAVSLSDGTGHLIKDLIGRQRPCAALEGVNLLVSCGRSFSMPSNHAANAFAFAMVFFFCLKRAETFFFIAVAAVISFSRIYVGVHYPSDVLAGALLGTGAAYLAVRLARRAEELYRNADFGQALFLMVVVTSLFRVYYILMTSLDLSPDEAHYWEWSRRLDWSYYSKGPLTALLIRAGTMLFGTNVLGVRFFAVILFALSSVLIYRVGKDLFNEKTGFISAMLIQVVPLYSVYGVLMTIDAPFICFWILSLFLFARLMKIRWESKDMVNRALLYWTALGFSIGLGILAKYTMGLFFVAGVLFLLSGKETRQIFFTPGPYIAIFISGILCLPVALWNASHGWVIFKHTAGQVHVSEGFALSPSSFFDFIGSQLGVITPVILILMFIALRKMRSQREGAVLFWFSVPVIVFFLLKSAQGKVQANWALPGYASGFIALSAWLTRNWESMSRKSRMVPVGGLILALAVTFFAHYPSILPLPQDKDPSARLFGWRELGREASRIFGELSVTGPAFIISDRYQVSSELAFYMDGNPVTYCVNLGRRMNQYDFWPGFENFLGQNAMVILTKERDVPVDIGNAFARCEREIISIVKGRGRNVKFTALKCYDFKGMKPAEFTKF